MTPTVNGRAWEAKGDACGSGAARPVGSPPRSPAEGSSLSGCGHIRAFSRASCAAPERIDVRRSYANKRSNWQRRWCTYAARMCSAGDAVLQPSRQVPFGRWRFAGPQWACHHSWPEERPASHHACGDHRGLGQALGLGPRARSSGCATCALPGARPSPCAAGKKKYVRPSWTQHSESAGLPHRRI